MNLDEDYGRKRVSLKKCQKIYNIIALYYIIVFAGIAFTEVYICVLNGSLTSLIGAFFSIATLAAGFGGVYIHKNIFAIAAPVLCMINTPFHFECGIFIPLCIICAVATVLANRKYRWLEDQDGFPYFNVRYRVQEIDKVQWNIKDPYTQNYEEIKKKENNSGHMDEL